MARMVASWHEIRSQRSGAHLFPMGMWGRGGRWAHLAFELECEYRVQLGTVRPHRRQISGSLTGHSKYPRVTIYPIGCSVSSAPVSATLRGAASRTRGGAVAARATILRWVDIHVACELVARTISRARPSLIISVFVTAICGLPAEKWSPSDGHL